MCKMAMNETTRALRAINLAKFKVTPKGFMESTRTLKLVGKKWKPAMNLHGKGWRMRAHLQLLNADDPAQAPTLKSRVAAYAAAEVLHNGVPMASYMHEVGVFNSIVNAAFAAEVLLLSDKAILG